MNDAVNHPSHYTDGKYEVIDAIECWGLGYHLGNALKYISRAGKKDKNKTIEDLEKAAWYLNRASKTRYFRLYGDYNKKIPVEDYCQEKKLSEVLTKAVHHMCEGFPKSAYTDVLAEIQYLKEKGEQQ